MGHLTTQVYASELLASIIVEACDILLPIALKHNSALAGHIATRLRYMAVDLSKQELYQMSPNIQSLSLRALRDLVEICNWPTLSTPERHDHLTESPQELRNLLHQMFKSQRSKEGMRCIEKFCRAKPDAIKPFLLRFTILSDELTKFALQGTGTDIAAYTQLNPPEKDVYPDEIHKLLLEGVRNSAICVPEYHGTLSEDDMHLTRLCLNSGSRLESQLALFNIITATSNMMYWQELAIRVPIIEIEKQDAQDAKNCQTVVFDPSKLSLVKLGAVCERLENPRYAKIHLDLDENCNIYERPDPDPLQHIISGCGVPLSKLLKQSELTVEHKIKLSYAIARAFWQFYGSELMNARWTSEDILFIPIDNERSELEGIPLRAFVSFPFGKQYTESPVEFCDEGCFIHRYPRILNLGIVLLEIGLGQPLRLERDSKFSLESRTNLALNRAKAKLKELKKAKWDEFQWKDHFIKAIENCLDSATFKETLKGRKSQRHGDTNEGDKTVTYSPLSERRDILYQKVVAPLSWLATVGFKDTDEVPVVPLPKKIQRKSTFGDDEEIQSFWSEIRGNPSFHSDSNSMPKFLDDLKLIAGHVLRCRRKAKVTTPIRVAILDTGCLRDVAFFQDSSRSERLKGWKDFTSVGSESETDDFGHGTFMARLLMHVAPIVDVYLIRIAKNTKDLENNQENIGKAIEYAGLHPDWKVDVVSMSFGFPYKKNETYPLISDAIDKVRQQRNGSILFLASAGNSWERSLDFPARHSDVIPIYAGDSKGQFSKSTPTQAGEISEKLGTYGTDIPPIITEEISDHFSGADLSAGTSIATAIAAGIVAMMLSYIAALPSMLGCTRLEQVCAKLYTKRGMEEMLHNMSLCTSYRQHFINPVWFWGQQQNDDDLLVSVCSAVQRMNKE